MSTNDARNRAVTMKDVAAHAGVSRTAVSLVLNGRHDVTLASETRARVLQAAADLGYRPNAGARALAQQRSDWYGLVTEIVTAPFAVEVIKGAQDRASSDGKYLLIASTESDPVAESAAIERLLEQRVEGLIYAATWHRAVNVPEIAREVPTVLVNCFDAEGRYPAVVPDERAGGRRAAERLLAAGHRRIGFVNLDPGIPAAVGRREGFHAALREAGVEPDDLLEISGHATAHGGFDAAAELLELREPPTAIFCANDRMAMGAYDAIKERGLRIPRDIAVIGFDNQELISAYLRPALTTIALPFEQMGSVGVDLLAETTAGESTDTKIVTVDCPLLERSSV
ncbi:LacI family DNA-binding transcriptional regulator [Microbacterium flavum]|uniref:LacI family DNA-binding transcriptional regulator n=1 Tax=Microbacterium flavum TaxID=415216 RepID=A0ABS5XU36_9MICO|nr:LacI family DNA-binding transcriptional regulator [Microbacterium flavum]MBT8798053.1 LacI family DNA-binding transcriptional regulator [Microbacterium flavum]